MDFCVDTHKNKTNTKQRSFPYGFIFSCALGVPAARVFAQCVLLLYQLLRLLLFCKRKTGKAVLYQLLWLLLFCKRKTGKAVLYQLLWLLLFCKRTTGKAVLYQLLRLLLFCKRTTGKAVLYQLPWLLLFCKRRVKLFFTSCCGCSCSVKDG